LIRWKDVIMVVGQFAKLCVPQGTGSSSLPLSEVSSYRLKVRLWQPAEKNVEAI